MVEVSGEVEDNTRQEAEVPIKVIPMPRPPPPFPQRLVKKTEDGKYRRFITMLKQLSINVPLVDRSLLRMMIECSILVLLQQDF